MTDLEGVAGVTQFENRQADTLDNHETRQRMRRLLTGEVNAAVEGFFEGGATEVVVNDGHGAGYTIDFERLDPRAQIIHGLERPVWLPCLDETCAATALVGAHAKACSPPATNYHTMSCSVKDWSINGVSIGEMGLQALIAGHFGVPMVFVSGEELACREIEALVPGIKTAAVKRGLSRKSAVSWTSEKARAMIRAAARDSVALISSVKPLRMDPPLLFHDERFEDLWATTPSAAGVRIIDASTREITAEDILDLMSKIYGYPRQYRFPSLKEAGTPA